MSEPEVLWRSYAITHVTDCVADPTKHRVIADFSDDISPVFPYLNATHSNVMYNPGANSVTIRRGVRILTFYPQIAMMAKVDGEEDALEQLEWFRQVCNELWAQREAITPAYERRVLLGPLDVYLLSPRLNCRACGEATCMAFGVALLLGRRGLGECPHLTTADYAEGGRRLAELLGTVGAGTNQL